jgi:hypothetical protein
VNQNSEQDIARVFAALRAAAPRHGREAMEQRLLASLKARAEYEATPTALWRRPIFWTAFTLAASCLLVLTAMHLAPHNTTQTIAAVPSSPTALSSRPDLAPNLSSRPKRSAVERPAVGTAPIAAEAALLADTNAPSHPAPPMPLTADERLLLRAARHTEQTSLAQLEPMPRPSARDSEDRAIEQFVKRNLASLALAESFNPTPATSAPNDPPTSNDTPAPNEPPN